MHLFKEIATISSRFYSVAASLKQYKVVPDIVDTPCDDVVSVVYPTGVKACMGNMLQPCYVRDEPIVCFPSCGTSFYTLLMTDPDAPSPQCRSAAEWHHWLVGNIPGSEISKGEVLTAYVGAGPPEGTGFHRYAFLVFKQPDRMCFDCPRIPNSTGKGRDKFCTREFMRKYCLEGPVAANLFHASWDYYVPMLYQQLGIKAE